MKLKVFYLLLMASLQVYAQSDFIREDKLWSQVTSPSNPQYPSTSTFIRMAGDTMINQIEYIKVFESEEAEMDHWNMIGYIREMDSGEVLYWDKRFESESLLYNFALQEGDSIQYLEDIYFFLDSIRTLPFGIYNEPQKHYFFSLGGHHLEETWIEGIGSLRGILCDLPSTQLVGEYTELLCFTEHDSMKYINERFNTCYFDNTGLERNLNKDISVYSHGHTIFINLMENQVEEYQIRILDPAGRIMLSSSFTGPGSQSYDVSELSKGVYIYHITFREGHKSGLLQVE